MLIKSFHWHFFFFLNTPLSSSRQAFKERASKSGFGSWNPVFTEIVNQRVLSGVPVVALPWAIWALRRHWEASLCLGVHGDLCAGRTARKTKNDNQSLHWEINVPYTPIYPKALSPLVLVIMKKQCNICTGKKASYFPRNCQAGTVREFHPCFNLYILSDNKRTGQYDLNNVKCFKF